MFLFTELNKFKQTKIKRIQEDDLKITFTLTFVTNKVTFKKINYT